MKTIRQKIREAFTDARPFRLGKTVFHSIRIDGIPVLQCVDWHGASSVIPSWYAARAADPDELLIAVWRNRRHHRNPWPSAPDELRERLRPFASPLLAEHGIEYPETPKTVKP